MAEIFNRKKEFYTTDSNVKKMKAFFKKEKHSEFEKTAMGLYDVNLKDVLYFEAVKAAYNNDIDAAIALMSESGTDSEFLGNPFNGAIKDCHDCDHYAQQKKKFTGLEFLQTIKKMLDKAKNDEDTYTNYMLIGNAFYNITFYGNGRSFYESKIIEYGYNPEDLIPGFRTLVTDCTLAASYYSKALSAAKNDEQRAKCQYMLAKCQRNQHYNAELASGKSWYNISYEGNAIDFPDWNGFQVLATKYSKTKYYKEVIKECSYFRIYLKGEKK